MKIIHVLLIIILVLGAILGIKIYNSKNPNEINKVEKYSIQDVQKILRKADNLTNYECKIDYGEFAYYKRKNNKIFLESVSGRSYRDYNENIEIYISNNNKNIYLERKQESEKIPSSNLYTSTVDADELALVFSKVLNVKEEKYNRITCLKVELELKAEKESCVFWIDLENGLIMKIEFPDSTIKEYEYKFNTVTDEDVNPDLTSYKKLVIEDGKAYIDGKLQQN